MAANNKDQDYLAQLRDYYARHGVFPPFSGIAKLVGLRSTSAVSALVGRLKSAGYLASTPDRRLQPGEHFFERDRSAEPVIAGRAEEAYGSASELVTIDRYLIDEPSRTVLIPIKGDSMARAGLLAGDTVVVKRSAPAQPGDIVVARVDGEFTVKYLAKDESGFYLKPGNDRYADIRPRAELDVFGKVTGSFRKY